MSDDIHPDRHDADIKLVFKQLSLELLVDDLGKVLHVLKGIFRDFLIRVRFSPHILILLHIKKDLRYSNLTSIGFL